MLLIIFVVGIDIGSSIGAPKNAIFYIDTQRKLYFSPPCLSDEQQKKLVKITHDSIPSEFNPDSKCRSEDGFLSEGRSLTGQFFENLGIIGSLPSRWNADGSWNW